MIYCNHTWVEIQRWMLLLRAKYLLCHLRPHGWFSKIRSQFIQHSCVCLLGFPIKLLSEHQTEWTHTYSLNARAASHCTLSHLHLNLPVQVATAITEDGTKVTRALDLVNPECSTVHYLSFDATHPHTWLLFWLANHSLKWSFPNSQPPSPVRATSL